MPNAAFLFQSEVRVLTIISRRPFDRPFESALGASDVNQELPAMRLNTVGVGASRAVRAGDSCVRRGVRQLIPRGQLMRMLPRESHEHH